MNASMLLQDAITRGTLVRAARQRNLKCKPSVGFVVETSEDLVVLNTLSDRIDLDGFEILRTRDITRVDGEFPRRRFFERALFLKGVTRRSLPPLDLKSISSALRSANDRFPLLVLSRERIAPDEVAIGRVSRWLPSGIMLTTMTPEAEWAEDRTLYRFSSLTRIQFGGEYEETLALVAQKGMG